MVITTEYTFILKCFSVYIYIYTERKRRETGD